MLSVFSVFALLSVLMLMPSSTNADQLNDALAQIGLSPAQIQQAQNFIQQQKAGASPQPSTPSTPTTPISPTSPQSPTTPTTPVSGASPAPGSGCCPHGQLKVDKNLGQLVGEDGKPVQLRGMSLFWSNFPEGSPFFNEQTVKCLKCNWNADIVRAPLGVEETNGYLTSPSTEYDKELAVVKAAEKNCMYVLIDWHYTSSTLYTDKAVEFFKKISAECAGKCNCLYETYNEPTSNDWSSQLKPYHETVIKAIRENDKNGIIIAGTPNWDQDVDKAAADPITDQDNIMYTAHFYAATHKAEGADSVGSKVDAAVAKKLPLFVTEYGTTSADGNGNIDTAETQKWFDKLDQDKISYINWAIDNKSEKSAALQPNTTPADVCINSKDTESGTFVKTMLRKQNPKPSGC